MELTRRSEAESLLRPDQRGVIMPHHSTQSQAGWESGEAEKSPFLRNEPVKLTPAWEGSNLPNDTLNLKGVGMDLVPPKDRGHLIFLTMILHGLGTLTAWNMFITPKAYFVDYKLNNATAEEEEAVSYYRSNFLVYISIASQTPNLFFSWFNVFVQMGGNLTTRIVWSLSVEVLIFVVTVVLAMVDTSKSSIAFFWITMVSVFFLNGFNAIFQNSVFGVAARLPPKYTGAVILGSNICGTLITLLEWGSSTVTESPRTAAIYYFIGGMFVLLLCFDTYFAMPLNRYYRYHETLASRAHATNPSLAASSPPPASHWAVIKDAAVQLYNVFITFFVTLTIFPAMHSDIYSETGFLGSHVNFMRITCFLTFNVTAMLGNITAGFVRFPTPKWLWVLTTLRLVLIPLFLFCNYLPGGNPAVRGLPVLIHSDMVYWALAVLLGWSSGHCSSLAMMYVSSTAAPQNAMIAGMVGGASLITGIVGGLLAATQVPVIVGLRF